LINIGKQKLKSVSFAKKIIMNQKDLKKLLKQELNKSISNIQIFEEGIDIHTQIEFENKTKLFFEKDNDNTELSVLENNLFNEKADFDTQKELLIELSFSNEVKAYRIIEKFHKVCEKELKKWTALALQKSRVHIEHSLGNEEKVYISSGLGGFENKLRYFFVLSSKENKTFNEFQKNILKKELNFAINKYEGFVEDIIFNDYYVTVLCMIPLNHSLDKIFISIIKECNSLGNFLSEKIIATNTEKFDNETVEGLLEDKPEVVKKFDDFANSLGLKDELLFDSDDDFEDFDDRFFEDDSDDDDYEDDDLEDDDILPF